MSRAGGDYREWMERLQAQVDEHDNQIWQTTVALERIIGRLDAHDQLHKQESTQEQQQLEQRNEAVSRSQAYVLVTIGCVLSYLLALASQHLVLR